MEETITLKAEKRTNSTDLPLYCFVCTGNTCRSPMAAALFNHKYPSLGYAVSHGISAFGEPAAEEAKAVLGERGITSLDSHRSSPVSEETVANAAAVIAMTPSHATQLLLAFPEAASKIHVMPKPIADPYGGSLDVYRRCLGEIEEGLSLLFESLLEEEI